MSNIFSRRKAIDDFKDGVVRAMTLEGFSSPTAVTLTFKRGILVDHHYVPLSRDAASRDLRHFLNVVSRKAISRSELRNGKRVACLPVYEDENVAPHYHLVVDRPDTMAEPEFEDLLWKSWQKTDFGNRQVDVRPCDEGWVRYILKRRTKSNFCDSIDWMNFHKPDSAV